MLLSKVPQLKKKCKRRVALSDGLHGLISGRELISALISAVYFKLAAGGGLI